MLGRTEIKPLAEVTRNSHGVTDPCNRKYPIFVAVLEKDRKEEMRMRENSFKAKVSYIKVKVSCISLNIK